MMPSTPRRSQLNFHPGFPGGGGDGIGSNSYYNDDDDLPLPPRMINSEMRSSSLPPSTTNVNYPAASTSNPNLSTRRASITPSPLKLASSASGTATGLTSLAPAVGVHLEPPEQEKSIHTTHVTTVGFSFLGFGAQRVRVIETLGCIRSQRKNTKSTFRLRHRFGLADLRFGNQIVKVPLDHEDRYHGDEEGNIGDQDEEGVAPSERSSTVCDDGSRDEKMKEAAAAEEGKSGIRDAQTTEGKSNAKDKQKNAFSSAYKLLPLIPFIFNLIRIEPPHLDLPTLPTFRHNGKQHREEDCPHEHRHINSNGSTCPRRDNTPYVVVGVWGPGNRVPKEVLVRVEEYESLFQAIRKGVRSLHTLPQRLLSLKSIQGFTIYQCHPDKGYHSALAPDPETRRILVELFCVYKSDEKDVHDRWLQWIQREFNNDSCDPRKGKYAIQLILAWSAMKFVIYGTIPIFLSLAVGIWYSFSQRGPGVSASDIVSIDQTAWTISSYIITTGGVAIAILAGVTQIQEF